MPEVSTEMEVTESQLPPGWGDRKPRQVPLRQLAGHWSERVRDPLGAALLRLNTQQSALDVLEATAESVQSSPPKSVVMNRVDQEHVESPPTVLSPQPSGSTDVSQTFAGSERRRFPRRQSECEVTLIDRQQTLDLTPQETDLLLRSSSQVGRLLDLSQTGLCLLQDVDVALGSEVLLRISNHQLNRHVDSAAKVVRSQSAGHGRFCIHCEVLQGFSLDQLQDLGRPLIHNHALA